MNLDPANLVMHGFDGFHTNEREVGAAPLADITKAADFLRSV